MTRMYAVLCPPHLDGICAAAILFRATRLRGAEPRIAGLLTHDNARTLFSEAAKTKRTLYFILDFLPENIDAFVPLLKAIAENNRIAYWNTHHPHDAKTADTLRTFAHTVDLSGPLHHGILPKEKKCAAELVQQRFLPNDSIARSLAEFAHDIEFWEQKDAQAAKLADLIASGFDARELTEILSRGVFWSARFARLHQEYCAKRDKALREITSAVTLKKYLTHTFAFSFAPSLLPAMRAGQELLDRHAGIDVAVILYRDGKISFRKRDTCDINLAELAKLFGGGGHAYAAGARLGAHTTRENLDETLFRIDRSLKNFFLQ